MFENAWTRQIEELNAKNRELKAQNLILFTENEHLKTANINAQESIVSLMREIKFFRKDRDYWHDQATKGGGHG